MAPKKIKVKPGKTQSKAGFFVGIAFILIGCIVVIPTFGPFGILWTAVAGFSTYSHYKNAYTEEGMTTREMVIEDDKVSNVGEDIEAKLKKLESLYKQGLITQEEYQEKRKEFLQEF